MKLLKEQETLLKYVPSVEVRAKIRSHLKYLIKEKKYKEINWLIWKLLMNRNKRERLIN